MTREIENFINQKNIAVLGASPSGKKFGNAIYRELKSKGYQVYPVHPTAESIENDRAYNSLKTLPAEVTAAVFAISPDKALEAVDDAVAHGTKRIWFQQGANFKLAVEKAKAAGIETVTKKCILMYVPPVNSIHAVHRFFAKIFGRV
ncbi:MAG: CoA-binding protein [candidate division Zixibacteria bacterium]|nr:CoA-binding protein [candidate division Zixibacteria bacterium]